MSREREITDQDEHFMQMAIDLSVENVAEGGGPFGAVIVKDGALIATGVNRVTIQHDPTAHAEVQAIRNACQKRGDFQLKDCVIYCSCEPCPMCLSALYWAGIKAIYFGNTKEDAESIHFGDNFIYEELHKPLNKRSVPMRMMMRGSAQKAFRAWMDKADRVEY